MKKNRLMQELNRELDGVRVSGNLKQRILTEAAASRAPSRRKSFSMRPLAIAAAVMVVCGLTAGMIALRQEKPDLSASTLSAAKVKTTQETVWVRLLEGLYHAKSDCDKVQDPVSMQLETARAAGLKGCSSCIDMDSAIADDLVWMTKFGTYYHSIKDCSGMADAVGVLELEAKTLGHFACPVCMDGEMIAPQATPDPVAYVTPAPTQTPRATAMAEMVQMAQPTPTPMAMVESTHAPVSVNYDAEEISVWMTSDGIYCHVEENFFGMENARSVSLKEAMLSGKEICRTCMTRTIWIDESAQQWHLAKNCSGIQDAQMMILDPGEQMDIEGCLVCAAGGIPVWATENGTFYHWDEHCSGMENALQIMESEAQESGKQACPTCLTIEDEPVSEVFDSDAAVDAEEAFVWATENGVFYHINEHCSGMSGAEYVPQNEAVDSGKMRCAVCMKNTVWVSDENVCYHIARYCSGMKDAVTTSEQEALDVNKQPCPSCMWERVQSDEQTEMDSDSVWWHPDDELYYHSDAHCGSNIFTAAEARGQSKAACAVCAENVEDDDFVWTNHDNHFHLDKYCAERPVYEYCFESEAIESGRTPCVLCMNGEVEAVDFECAVWRTTDGELYHRAQNCSGMKNARQTGKSAAEKEGKQPCSVCMGEIPVWIEDGAYYHMRKSCSGVDTPAQVAESVAGKDGKQACPICYTEEELIPWRTEVWITGDYFYHADEQCSEVVMLSDYKECCLEADAIEWGKLPCETCLSQRYEVPEEPEGLWMTDGGVYYHTKRRCMGIVNAHSCTIEEALAYGKQPCPSCAKQILYYDSDAVSETETVHHAESEEHR